VAHHDRGAHRETQRRHPRVPQLAGPGDRRLQVEHLEVADGADPARPAVAAEVEADHPADLAGEQGGDPSQRRPAPGAGEAVGHHDREVTPARSGRIVAGVDGHAVLGAQSTGLRQSDHGSSRADPFSILVPRISILLGGRHATATSVKCSTTGGAAK
jgi:hypothetical protein